MAMKNVVFLGFCFVCGVAGAAGAAPAGLPPSVAPDGDVALFNGRDLAGWHVFLKGRARGEDPQGVFSVSNGILRISGAEYGGICTDAHYRDYKLTVEYRFTGVTPPIGAGRAPDFGILFHSQGPDGAWHGIWKKSFKYNILRGRTGDLVVVDDEGRTKPVYTMRTTVDPRGVYSPRGERLSVSGKGRCDSPFTPKSWQNLPDTPIVPPERPLGEWNVAELVCCAGSVDCRLNGVRVNAAQHVWPASGQIQLQSEAAGVEVRKVVLSPVVPPAPANVPPLLETFTGRPIRTKAKWEKVRRPELLDAFQRLAYGRCPPAAEKPEVTFSAAAPDREMLGGTAVRKRVRIAWQGPFGASNFVATAFIPKSARPVPAFVLIGNRDPAATLDPERTVKSPFWPVEEIVARGYAAIAFSNGDVAPDCDFGNTQGVFACYEKPVRYRNRALWGTLRAWAWGASRVMDWIESEPLLDAAHVAVVGHSRGGKTALIAGVFDPRFAMVCANDSGCGGAKLNHLDLPASEHYHDLEEVFPYWFCRAFARMAGHEDQAACDQHQWLALVAPRLLAVGSATQDSWAGPAGEYWAAKLASPAWGFYGMKGLEGTDFPPPGRQLMSDGVSYHLRDGVHDLTLEDWNAYLDFAEAHHWRDARPKP
ncbi:MAG: family 16 glycoside hydrolase [Kiritimatiellia bacterium]